MLILASTSPTRQNLLKNAGVAFESVPPKIDEADFKNSHTNRDPADLAVSLAIAKSKSLSGDFPNRIIIGSDQTLICDNIMMSKPTSHWQAKSQLLNMRKQTHLLTSAVACTLNGALIWQFQDHARMTMRNFSDAFLESYLSEAPSDILSSVGAYKLEGVGIQLFENIEGNYFTILGFPLLELLKFLRSQGELMQ